MNIQRKVSQPPKVQGIGFFRKFLFMLCIVMVGFSVGSSCRVILAWSIPGIDKPFDPANYYSPTSVSIPDSAPSIFTMRDLEGQGGAVYDYTRHMKNIAYYDKMGEWHELIKEKLGIDLSMILHFDDETNQKVSADFARYADNISSARSSDMSSLPDYMTSDGDVIGDAYYEKYQKQSTYLSDTYRNSATAVQQNVNNAQDVYNALQEALERNHSATSKMQVKEIQEQIAALEIMSKNILANMYAEQAKIRTAHNTYENTQRIEQLNREAQYTVKTFLNPYDEQDKKILESLEKHSNFKVYHSKGMPDF